MTEQYYSIITNIGLEKNANASVNSINLNLTQLGIGDSNGDYYEPTSDQNVLHNELHRANLTNVVIDEDNPNQLIVEAVIDETIGPFYIREVGIFDSDGDLFAIGKYPETFKPNLPTGSGKRLYIRMILGFSSSPNVNLVISDDINNDPNFTTNIYNKLDEKLSKSQNLDDLEDIQKARDNLNLGSAALANASSLVPTACVLPFSGNVLPEGYLECNGASLSRITYSTLFSIIGTTYGSNDSNTFNIPDLRGEFIRGFDNGRGVDSSRSLGSYQSDLFKSHNHSYTALSRWGANPGGQAPYWCRGDSGGGNATGNMTYSGGNETRPRNIALKYIIKF